MQNQDDSAKTGTPADQWCPNPYALLTALKGRGLDEVDATITARAVARECDVEGCTVCPQFLADFGPGPND